MMETVVDKIKLFNRTFQDELEKMDQLQRKLDKERHRAGRSSRECGNSGLSSCSSFFEKIKATSPGEQVYVRGRRITKAGR
jgi:hypothetical protein